jgi:hypothetical protein
MSLNIPFITPGQASANAANAANLGKKVIVDGKIYVLAKATSAIALAAEKAVETAYVAGVPNWNVDIPAAAVSCGFGIIPTGQVGSTGTTGLVAGDYFLLQISGPATCIAGCTLVDTSTVQAGLAASSLGYMIAYAASSVGDTQNLRNTSYLTNTAVVAISATGATCVLSGLV